MKTYLVHYKEWVDSGHWAHDGEWITKSKIVQVTDAIELGNIFQNIEKIKRID